ncbi:hypothetical protein [Paenibacillus lautus]|nr:hypothetical protein [Paenibacillus lautus]MEC0259807.1 hypothetical protein [Paenibacillus lautus]
MAEKPCRCGIRSRHSVVLDVDSNIANITFLETVIAQQGHV